MSLRDVPQTGEVNPLEFRNGAMNRSLKGKVLRYTESQIDARVGAYTGSKRRRTDKFRSVRIEEMTFVISSSAQNSIIQS